VTSRRAAGWDLVVKVGGSLGRRRGGLAPIMRALAAVARAQRVLVVPGGGVFADLVRREMRRLGLTEPRAHAMALLAMDQYALVLAGQAPGARPVTTLAAARRAAAEGRLPILLAARFVGRLGGRGGARHGGRAGGRGAGLERSFRLTSDAIAAWVAARIGARRLVLLKNVRGLDLPIGGRAAAARAARRGLVDPLFARHLPAGAAVRLVDGRAAGLRDDLSRRPAGDAPRRGWRRGRRARAPRRAAPGARRRTARRAPR
jgi:aspartokinase-like uncharacterized kinase